MKKILTLLIILVTLLCSNIICSKQENSEIKWRVGVAIINDEPKYFDPAGLVNPDMFMSPKYRNKIKREIINAGLLAWGDEKEPYVYIYDVYKDRPYRWLSKTKRVLPYKVEHNNLYLSEDNKKWERVKFKVINDKEHIAEDDPTITVYWVIYLECKWFKGEYEIISVPNA